MRCLDYRITLYLSWALTADVKCAQRSCYIHIGCTPKKKQGGPTVGCNAAKQLNKKHCNFSSVFNDRTSFRAKGSPQDNKNHNFSAAFDNRTSFCAKLVCFVIFRGRRLRGSKREWRLAEEREKDREKRERERAKEREREGRERERKGENRKGEKSKMWRRKMGRCKMGRRKMCKWKLQV